MNILAHAFLKPCATMYPAWELAFLEELMITQRNVLLMEMLCLDSVLIIIIIVTDLAWEPISPDLYPWLHSNSISHPEPVPWNRSPWLIFCWSYLRMYALGKGPVELSQTLRYPLYLFSAASRKAHKAPLTLERRVPSYPNVSVGSFFCPFHFK